MSEKWYEVLGGIFKAIMEWFGVEKNQDAIKFIIEIIIIIITGVGKFNKEPSGEQKRQYARGIAKFIKYTSVKDFDRLAELKRTGAFDSITSDDLDITLGALTAFHCKVSADGDKIDTDSAVMYLKDQF